MTTVENRKVELIHFFRLIKILFLKKNYVKKIFANYVKIFTLSFSSHCPHLDW